MIRFIRSTGLLYCFTGCGIGCKKGELNAFKVFELTKRIVSSDCDCPRIEMDGNFVFAGEIVGVGAGEEAGKLTGLASICNGDEFGNICKVGELGITVGWG